MRAVCVIPSRYGSVRLPGKPLIDLNGKTLIRRVYERAKAAELVDDVVVATDDPRICDEVMGFGGKSVMTPVSLPTGSDRVARAMEEIDEAFDIVLNLQGDEPQVDPKDLDRLLAVFQENPDTELVSLMAPLHAEEDVNNINYVKVVVDEQHMALYFSRLPVPYWRKREDAVWNQRPANYWLHIGVYAFRREVVSRFACWPRSSLEIAESLEQLRLLEHGVRVKMLTTPHPWHGINTLEDVERVRLTLKSHVGA